MTDIRPTWQVDDCPPWCAGAHGQGDHPDDRVHRSAGNTVPVVVRVARLGAVLVEHTVDAAEFEVALSRRDGSNETWLYVGDGPGRSFELSAESARRLVLTAEARLAGMEDD